MSEIQAQIGTLGARLDTVEPSRVEGLFGELDAICSDKMAREQVAREQVRVQHFLDIRYIGQSYELEVPLDGAIDRPSLDGATAEFHRLHEVGPVGRPLGEPGGEGFA